MRKEAHMNYFMYLVFRTDGDVRPPDGGGSSGGGGEDDNSDK